MNVAESSLANTGSLSMLSPQMTPTAANNRLTASQSMSHVLISSQMASEKHNRPNLSNPGTESSLSFTKRLIEETAARNER